MPSPRLVATLVANPDRPVLDRRARRPGGPGARRWNGSGRPRKGHRGRPLSPGAATPGRSRRRLRATLAAVPSTSSVQPALRRRKRLFLADMDSTMIGQECIDELADYVGLKAEVAAITERAMRGEIAFEPALRERVALLRTLPVGVVDGSSPTASPSRPAAGPSSARCAATAPIPASSPAASPSSAGRSPTASASTSTGRTGFSWSARPWPARSRSRSSAARPSSRRWSSCAQRIGAAPDETLAVGDGANDLAMLQEAGLGVAFRAKPAVAAAAAARIEHADLTALLYAQGYGEGDIARG